MKLYWKSSLFYNFFQGYFILRAFKKSGDFYPGEFHKDLHSVRISANLLLSISSYVQLNEQ